MHTHNVRLIFDPAYLKDDAIWPVGMLAFVLEQVTGNTLPNFAATTFEAWERRLKDYYRLPDNTDTWVLDIQLTDGIFHAGGVEYSRGGHGRHSRGDSVEFLISTPQNYDEFLSSDYVDFGPFLRWHMERSHRGWSLDGRLTLREQPFNPVPPKKLGRRNLKPVPLP